MPRFEIPPEDRTPSAGDEGPIVKPAALERFAPTILGLGDIAGPCSEEEAICCIFDLAGFTNFCKHQDPHLTVPSFLSSFLNWLFRKHREQLVVDGPPPRPDHLELHAEPPFLAKFLGDGVLFLWKATDDEVANCNVIVSATSILAAYTDDFLPSVQAAASEVPSQLRCGIARGRILSVGNGTDFVGPCINLAARLQKLSTLSIAVHRHGFDLDKHMDEGERRDWILRKTRIRGIGDGELVWILKREYNRLTKTKQREFRNP